MTITAKYPGTCRECGGRIQQGDRIEWEKGAGAAHVECPAQPTVVEREPDEIPFPNVPDGRYAVQIRDTDEWDLLRVWRGTRNPAIVHVYRVKGTERGVRVEGAAERGALALIAEDPGQAAIEFGHRTGSCSRCGLELDKNLSRHLGIGPVCMKHWFDDETRLAKMRAGREELRADGIDPEDSFDRVEPPQAFSMQHGFRKAVRA
jgi:hypothetical protein